MMMSRKVRDPEAAYWDREVKAETEAEDFGLFANAYQHATGIELVIQGRPEPPDFECRRADGSLVGVELTQITWSPDDAMIHRIMEKHEDMPLDRAWDEAERLLLQKSNKLHKFPTDENILVLINCKTEFRPLKIGLLSVPVMTYEGLGFTEVWLGDYTAVREGAHSAIEMQGLFPEELRVFVPSGLTPTFGTLGFGRR